MRVHLFLGLLCTSAIFANQNLPKVYNVSIGLDASSTLNVKRAPGKYRNAAYFVNWAIYGRNFLPENLTASLLTHVLYAFANIRPDTGEVYLSDTWADTDKHFANDSWSDTGHNLYGCAKQLFVLKKRHRHLKTLLSIGGWTYSPSFAPMASNPASRAKFASSSVSLLANLGFDGLDIDWEYPANDAQATDMVLLLQAVREALDHYSSANGLNYHFLLTVASPAGPQNYNTMHLKEMDQYLDHWNMMCYDYAGSFSPKSGHQANLYPNDRNEDSTPFSTHKAVTDYIAAGVPARKIVIGIPIYGRAFDGTSGLGQPFSGVGAGSWENGIWDYKDLPRPGAPLMYDELAGAGYSFDSSAQTLVSFDTEREVLWKTEYAVKRGLGGSMFWEASADKKGAQSLIGTAARVWADEGGMDETENCLRYPLTEYQNLRDGMPGE